MKSTPALHIQLAKSRIEKILLILMCLFAMAMPWLTGLVLWLRLCAAALVFCVAGWEWWRQLGRPLPSLRLHIDGLWGIDFGEGEVDASLLPGALCTAVLIVMPLKLADGKVLRLVLWPDSASADQLRQLRSWLRWGSEATAKALAKGPESA